MKLRVDESRTHNTDARHACAVMTSIIIISRLLTSERTPRAPTPPMESCWTRQSLLHSARLTHTPLHTRCHRNIIPLTRQLYMVPHYVKREVTTLWRYRNKCIIILLLLLLTRQSPSKSTRQTPTTSTGPCGQVLGLDLRNKSLTLQPNHCLAAKYLVLEIKSLITSLLVFLTRSSHSQMTYQLHDSNSTLPVSATAMYLVEGA